MRVDKTLETKPLSSLRCTGPVKQKRALLESNPPRDSWTEGDEMNVSTSGEAQTSPDAAMESFISEPSHALKTHPKNKLKISLSQYPLFRSKRTLALCNSCNPFNFCQGSGIYTYLHLPTPIYT